MNAWRHFINLHNGRRWIFCSEISYILLGNKPQTLLELKEHGSLDHSNNATFIGTHYMLNIKDKPREILIMIDISLISH